MIVVCEVMVRPTEKALELIGILKHLINADFKVDNRGSEVYIYGRTSGNHPLKGFTEKLRDQRITDVARSQIRQNVENETLSSVYLSRQALAMEKISFVGFNDNIPLGPILLQIILDEDESWDDVLDVVAPKTFKGREVSIQEYFRLVEKERAKKQKKG